ncbi:MAG: hypothetical protein K6F57_00765 [Candidatus Saccharibacteria bacterium]|nr:hypothetical protein [Candidatus Saccharibacteria bacterium]
MATFFNREDSFSNGGDAIEVIAGMTAEATENINRHSDANRDAIIGANAEGVRTVRDDIKIVGDKVDANGETVLKSWFWPLAAVAFAIIAFVVFFFTKNIEYVPSLDAQMNQCMIYNYPRWIIVFGVPTIAVLLMSMCGRFREPKTH